LEIDFGVKIGSFFALNQMIYCVYFAGNAKPAES